MKSALDTAVLMQEAGQRLRVARRALGFKHAKDLAEALGYEDARYRNWEGGRHFPPFEVLALLRKKYGIPADWIVNGEEAMLPKELAPKIARLLKQQDETCS